MVCDGSTVSLSVAGANTYTWSNGNTQSITTITASTGINTFSVTGSYSATSCLSNLTHTLLGIPYPTLSIVGTTLVCVGELLTLNATGADNFTWNGTLANNTFTTYAAAPLQLTLIGANANLCRDTVVLYTIPEECVGLNENSLNSFRIFPNPANAKLFIESQSNAAFELYEISGKLVHKTILNEGLNEISILNFAEGLYLVKLSDGVNMITSRLIIDGK
jgi:hypothetical protein